MTTYIENFKNFTEYLQYFQREFTASDYSSLHNANTLQILVDKLNYETRNFLVYLYNTDMANSHKNPLGELKAKEFIIHNHCYFLNSKLKNNNTYFRHNISQKTIKFIKSLPFYTASVCLTDSLTTKRIEKQIDEIFPIFDISQTSIETYWNNELIKSSKGENDVDTVTYNSLLKAMVDVTNTLTLNNHNFSLFYSDSLQTTLIQLYFWVHNTDVPANMPALNSNEHRLSNKDYEYLRTSVIKHEFNPSDELRPLLSITDKDLFSKFKGELLNVIRLPNNLNYNNAEVLKIVSGLFPIKLNSTATYYPIEHFPQTYVQTILFEALTDCKSKIFDDREFVDIVSSPCYSLLKHYYSYRNSVGYVNLFTPTQLNEFLIRSAKIQNRILELLGIVYHEKTLYKLNYLKLSPELVNVLKIFYKMIYSYYCNLNSLDHTKVYSLKEELKTYHTYYYLQTKFDDCVSLTEKYYVTASREVDNLIKSINFEHLLYDHYYAMEFVHTLPQSEEKELVINELYDAYSKEIFQNILNIPSFEDWKLRYTNHYLIEAFINAIPYHYIRLVYKETFKTYDYLRTFNDTKHSITINTLHASFASILKLTLISHLALL